MTVVSCGFGWRRWVSKMNSPYIYPCLVALLLPFPKMYFWPNELESAYDITRKKVWQKFYGLPVCSDLRHVKPIEPFVPIPELLNLFKKSWTRFQAFDSGTNFGHTKDFSEEETLDCCK